MNTDRRREITYIANNLTALNAIPFGEYNANGELIEKYWMNGSELPGIFKPYICDMIRHLDERRVTKITFENLPIALWVYFSLDEHYYVWGPVQYEKFTREEQKIYDELIDGEYPDYQVYRTDYSKVLGSISCFAYAVDQRFFSFDDMQQVEERMLVKEAVDRQNVEYMIEQEDNSADNHTYSEEQYPLDLLRKGDEEGIIRYVHSRRLLYPDVLKSNTKKNEEYMAVAAVSVLTRAAIEAGVTSVESFRMSDVFLSRIAQCKEGRSIVKEREEALIAFTRLVKRSHNQAEANPYVEDCKKYIAAHIFQKISLDDIAKDLGVRATYLSRLFSKSEDTTVGQYIRKEKIKVATNMLKFSNRTIAEIADYLGFNSQSYFGKIFKEEIGMTPELYRKKFRAPEF